MKSTILLFLLTPFALAQGPLTPPPGADPSIGPVNALTAGGMPQATMKTLHQVEPRTAIPGGTATVTINQSGSYYLTGNITVAGGNGITISSSNVTLDLNGFTVASAAAPVAGTGIALNEVLNVSVRNGNIGGGFAGGVRYVQLAGFPSPPFNVRLADLSISYVTEVGIQVVEAQVERCMVFCSDPAALGIGAWSVKDSRVRGGNITGTVVKDCYVTNTSSNGITAQVAENCYATSAGTAIQAKCLVNSYGTGGGDHDVISAGVAQNVWAEGGSGTGDGIEANVVSNAFAQRTNDLGGQSTGVGLRASVIDRSQAISPAMAVSASVVSGIHAQGGGDVPVIGASVVVNSKGSALTGYGDGIQADVVAHSFGTRQNSYVIGSPLPSGIKSTVVTGSMGHGYWGIDARSGQISESVGTGSKAIYGKIVTSSIGLASSLDNSGAGIVAELVHSSFGQGNAVSPGDAMSGIQAQVVMGSRGMGASSPGSFGIDTVSNGFVVSSFGENTAFPANKINAVTKFHSN